MKGKQMTMTIDELRERNAQRKIFQIALVTRDLEHSMKAWVEELGIGPWTVLTFTNETVRDLKVAGKPVTEPFKFLIAIATVGDIDFELIQPVYGPTIYEEFLQRRGEGLHHIKEKIAEGKVDSVVSDYADKGIGVMQTGWFDVDVHYYMDTESKLDFIFELGNCPRLELAEGSYSMYPKE
jgi:methylmalonyl-CoA/ethylmalonyl-CoA epimerase